MRNVLVAGVLSVSIAVALFAQGTDMGVGLPSKTAKEGFTPNRGEAKRVAHRLICFCGCERMTIDDCGCGFAYEQLARIESLLKEGKTEDEIVALYVEEQGEKVLSSPTAEGLNLVAWTIPFAGLLAGVGVLWFMMKRLARPGSERGEPAQAGSPVDVSLLERAERELKQYKDF